MIVDASGLCWSVDPQGYEWMGSPGGDAGGFFPSKEGSYLVHKGQGHKLRLVREYPLSPLEMPNLFYQLATTPPMPEGIVEFADRYGFLGAGTMVPVDWKPPIDWGTELQTGTYFIPGELISDWEHEIETIALAYRCWSALRNESQEELAALDKLLTTRETAPSFLGSAWPQNKPPSDPVAASLEFLISRGLRDRVSGTLRRRADGAGWETNFSPSTLIGAIWIQFAQAVAEDVWKDCQHCGEPFKPKNRRAVYCSDSHRQLAYQKRKAKGESP